MTFLYGCPLLFSLPTSVDPEPLIHMRPHLFLQIVIDGLTHGLPVAVWNCCLSDYSEIEPVVAPDAIDRNERCVEFDRQIGSRCCSRSVVIEEL